MTEWELVQALLATLAARRRLLTSRGYTMSNITIHYIIQFLLLTWMDNSCSSFIPTLIQDQYLQYAHANPLSGSLGHIKKIKKAARGGVLALDLARRVKGEQVSTS